VISAGTSGVMPPGTSALAGPSAVAILEEDLPKAGASVCR
jgi:hypothetical protein